VGIFEPCCKLFSHETPVPKNKMLQSNNNVLLKCYKIAYKKVKHSI
jgi:hypothetical protein